MKPRRHSASAPAGALSLCLIHVSELHAQRIHLRAFIYVICAAKLNGCESPRVGVMIDALVLTADRPLSLSFDAAGGLPQAEV